MQINALFTGYFAAEILPEACQHLMFMLTFWTICITTYFIIYAYLVMWLLWKSDALENDILLYSI